jgi:DNA polymerase V
MDKYIMCIDFKSFYASVECVDRNLDPFATKLVVADKSHGTGSIILAVSPYLKSFGVPSRLRIFELPDMDDIIFAKPRMSRYMEVASKAIKIFLRHVCYDDIHVYSIDESFIDITHYLLASKKSPIEFSKMIKDEIFDELGLTTTVGLAPNMFLAKVALDVESKHVENGIAYWTYDDVKNKLQKVTPLHKIWSIGPAMETKLNKLGIYTLKDVADLPKEYFVSKFGVIGGELHDHANGIDDTDIRDKYVPSSHSITSGQVLMKDYSYKDMPLLIREMSDDLLFRLRKEGKLARKVGLYIGYSKEIHGGFATKKQLINYTDDNDDVYNALLVLLNENIKDYPIRRISLSLDDLISSPYYRPNLLSDISSQEKKRSLNNTIDAIKEKYGMNAIIRVDQLLENSTIIDRHSKIGGHAK